MKTIIVTPFNGVADNVVQRLEANCEAAKVTFGARFSGGCRGSNDPDVTLMTPWSYTGTLSKNPDVFNNHFVLIDEAHSMTSKT